jgi:hypothetical protein
VSPNRVRCPWCKADTGRQCTTGRRTLRQPHPSRVALTVACPVHGVTGGTWCTAATPVCDDRRDSPDAAGLVAGNYHNMIEARDESDRRAAELRDQQNTKRHAGATR